MAPTSTPTAAVADEIQHTEESSAIEVVPSEPIQIVTWYMGDALGFNTLVNLLTTHPLYETSVRKLEMVSPTNQVSDDTVEDLLDWIETSESLHEIIIFLVKELSDREMDLMERIEEVSHNNCRYGATIKILAANSSQVDLLCDSLSPLESSTSSRRHLAMDGKLLAAASPQELQQLAFDISWDRSIHVLLLKDMPDNCLTAILPKLVYGPLHTLKITFDPESGERRLQDAKPMATRAVKDILKASRLKTLQRLYLGHVRFDAQNTTPLVEGCLQSKTLQQLELCLCQFESGTGHLWQPLVDNSNNNAAGKAAASLRQVQFYYPIITNNKTQGGNK
ncbi:expressed unknown protein [Seminavis robusta]|uniref:Uncharacterized protein n=1 Tax=Seminavis robusta TaxID=568900 RepID=A0A9N8H957_9STRA|nr:expressed unknown protein [Seminavis robusta]|eukprot:Sro194_g082820.1 n/a (336) ;mRNA; f:42874-43881